MSQREYDIGSLGIIDVVHIPTGCSAWPVFWTKGHKWQDDGEIDIIEGIDWMTYNQIALYTLCQGVRMYRPHHRRKVDGSGEVDCFVDAVIETSPNSFDEAFMHRCAWGSVSDTV